MLGVIACMIEPPPERNLLKESYVQYCAHKISDAYSLFVEWHQNLVVYNVLIGRYEKLSDSDGIPDVGKVYAVYVCSAERLRIAILNSIDVDPQVKNLYAVVDYCARSLQEALKALARDRNFCE